MERDIADEPRNDDLLKDVTSEWKKLLTKKKPCGDPLEDDDPQDCREED